MGIDAVRNRIYRINANEKPEIPRFSTQYIDEGIDPFDDFFHYSNGKWIKDHPIPKEKPYWGAFMELFERNRYILGKILETCAFNQWQDDPARQMVGRFYLSAMDTETIERLRFQPIEGLMREIESLESRSKLMEKTADLHRRGIPVLFSFESSPDDRNSSVYAYRMSQGGISLPNRDYYILESFGEIRGEFRNHVRRMFMLYGLHEESAAEYAETVFDIELRLAEVSRSPVELRDPEKNYTRFDWKNIQELSPRIDFGRYFDLSGLSGPDYIVVGQPEFFTGLGKVIEDIPLEKWKVYLKWKVLHFAASYLHDEVENENFDFYYRNLLGQPEREKRWKQVVSIIDMYIGEALGRLYVEEEFGEEHRKRMSTMVDDIKEVFAERLQSLEWMSDATKTKALGKFNRFRTKIGYPSKYLDYSSIRIVEDDYLGNVMRSNEFEWMSSVHCG